MKIVADENIPFVAECFSSIGEVEVAQGREITPSVVADADVRLLVLWGWEMSAAGSRRKYGRWE